MTKIRFGERKDPNQTLKALFEEKLFSVADLAKTLDVTRQMVYNYLEGKTPLDLSKIFKICEEYPVPISFFVEDEEIFTLKERNSQLEYIVKNLLLEKWSKEKKTNPPDSIYDFPEVQAQLTMYRLSKDPLYGIELEKALKRKGKNP